MTTLKNQKKYIPYITGKNYAIKLTMLVKQSELKPDSPLKDSVQYSVLYVKQNTQAPEFNGLSIKATVDRNDSYCIIGASLLAAYYGKDITELALYGYDSKDLAKWSTNIPDNVKFGINKQSPIEHLKSGKVSAGSPVVNTDLTRLAHNLREGKLLGHTPAQLKDMVVTDIEIKYDREAFDSLYDANFAPTKTAYIDYLEENYRQIEQQKSDLGGTLQTTGGIPMGVDAYGYGLSDDEVYPRSNLLQFDSVEDFSDKLRQIQDLLAYYEKIQKDSFLVLKDEAGIIDFKSLIEEIDYFKADVVEYLRVNGYEDFIGRAPTLPGFEFYVYLTNNGEFRMSPVKFSNKREEKIAADLVKQDGAGVDLDYVDLLRRQFNASAQESFKFKHYFPSSSGISQGAKLNSSAPEVWDELLDSHAVRIKKASWLNIIAENLGSIGPWTLGIPLWGSDQSGQMVDIVHNSDPFPDVLTSTAMRTTGLWTLTSSPRMMLVMTSFNTLIKMAGSTSGLSLDPCWESYATALQKSQKITSIVASGKPAKEQAQELAKLDQQNAETLEPPDLLSFGKTILQYPKDQSGGQILPSTAPQEIKDSYDGIKATLADDLTVDEQIEIWNIARNKPQQPKPNVPVSTRSIGGNTAQRTAQSVLAATNGVFGGVTFMNSSGEIDVGIDIKKAMARKDVSFADQISDEIFRMTPRTPAKIRSLDDAYDFFLAKLSLSQIATEAMKCTWLQHSLDDIIEWLCDQLLEGFFEVITAGNVDDPEKAVQEVVKYIDKIRYGTYSIPGVPTGKQGQKIGGVDLSAEVHQAFESIITSVKKWSEGQMAKTHTSVAEELDDSYVETYAETTVAVGTDLAEEDVTDADVPFGGSGAAEIEAAPTSIYGDISGGLGRDTKRVLCELLIAGGAAAIRGIISLFDDNQDLALKRKTIPDMKYELSRKDCPNLLAISLPDNLPHWSRILGHLTKVLEQRLMRYVEQVVIVPLRNFIIKILNQCNDDPKGTNISSDNVNLGPILGALEIFDHQAALKRYINDVFTNLKVSQICALLRGNPDKEIFEICTFILKNSDYITAPIQAIFATSEGIQSFFKKVGDASDLAFCDQYERIRDLSDLCGDIGAATELLRETLKSLGLSEEQIDSQLNLEAELNRENFKAIVQGLLGDPNNIISNDEVHDIIAEAVPDTMEQSAISQVFDDLPLILKDYDLATTKDLFSKVTVNKEKQFLYNPESDLDNSQAAMKSALQDSQSSDEAIAIGGNLPLAGTPNESETVTFFKDVNTPEVTPLDSVAPGSIAENVPRVFRDEIRIGSSPDLLFQYMDDYLIYNVDEFRDFVYKKFWDNTLKDLDTSYEGTNSFYQILGTEMDIGFSDPTWDEAVETTQATWAAFTENLPTSIIQKFISEHVVNNVYSKVFGLQSLPYTDNYLNIETIKKAVQKISKENFKNLDFDAHGPVHLYDALFEGVLIVYTRLLMIELVLTSAGICSSASAQKIISSDMVKKYVFDSMYPDLENFYSNIELLLKEISETYLKPSSPDETYNASLTGIDELCGVLFGKMMGGLCDTSKMDDFALPMSFEDVNNMFPFVGAGDTLMKTTSNEKVGNNFCVEPYVSFERINSGAMAKLTQGQRDSLTELRVIPKLGESTAGQSHRHILSFDQFQDVYDILFNSPLSPTKTGMKKHLIPIGYYSTTEAAAEWQLTNDGVNMTTKPMYYNANYQLFKYMMGFLGQKYFGSYIREFIPAWVHALRTPYKQTNIAGVDGQYLTYIYEKPEDEPQYADNDYTNPELVWKIDNFFFPYDGSDASNAIQEWKEKILFCGWKAHPGYKDNDSTGQDNEALYDSFKDFFPNTWIAGEHQNTLGAAGWKKGSIERKGHINSVFFPFNFCNTSAHWNLAQAGCWDKTDDDEGTYDYIDLRGIPYASVNYREDYTMGPDIFNTHNLIFVKDWKNRTVNDWFDFEDPDEGLILDEPPYSNWEKTSRDLVDTWKINPPSIQKKYGTTGRMLGKFQFTLKLPSSGPFVKTAAFREDESYHEIAPSFGTTSYKVPTKQQFIDMFNEKAKAANVLYQELLQTKAQRPVPPTSVCPNGIIQLKEDKNNPDVPLVAVSAEDGRQYELFFENVTVQVPVRLFNGVALNAAEWYQLDAGESKTYIAGVRYDDDDTSMGFVETRPLNLVRVYYVEADGESYIGDESTLSNWSATKVSTSPENDRPQVDPNPFSWAVPSSEVLNMAEDPVGNKWDTTYNDYNYYDPAPPEFKNTTGTINESTLIPQIFNNFKYGMRISLNINESQGNTDWEGLVGAFKHADHNYPSQFFKEKAYSNSQLTPPGYLAEKFPDGDFDPEGKEWAYYSYSSPFPSDEIGDDTLQGETFLFPLLTIEKTPTEMFEMGLIPSSDLTVVDSIKNFPNHPTPYYFDLGLKPPAIIPRSWGGSPANDADELAPRIKEHQDLIKEVMPTWQQIRQTNGIKVGNSLYCEMMRSEEAHELFGKIFNVSNMMGALMIYQNSKMNFLSEQSFKEEPFSFLKESLAKTVCELINKRAEEEK